MNPRFEDIAIFPKFLLLVESDERSARYALAIEIFPPVMPSIALARNKTSNGTITTNVPRKAICILKVFEGKNKAKRNSNQPIDVPTLLNRRIFFLPYLSDHFPNIGDPIS